jgi:hypothetical protein
MASVLVNFFEATANLEFAVSQIDRAHRFCCRPRQSRANALRRFRQKRNGAEPGFYAFGRCTQFALNNAACPSGEVNIASPL